MSFSDHHIKCHVLLSVGLNNHDINFDHLVEIVYTRSLHTKVTAFLSLVNKYPVGKCFETIYIPYSSTIFQPITFSNYDDFLTPSILLYLKVFILFYRSPSVLLIYDLYDPQILISFNILQLLLLLLLHFNILVRTPSNWLFFCNGLTIT